VKKFVLGLQHLLAAFGATILVPLLVGIDPKLALFSAGVGTLIFHICTKMKVPVFLGSSFAFVAPLITVFTQTGDYAYAAGGSVVAGALYLVFAMIVKIVGVEKISKLFPPHIVGTMIIIIGMTLAPTAVSMASENWIIALVALSTALLISTLTKGFVSNLSVIIGMSVGYIVASLMGEVDFSILKAGSVFAVPEFVIPKFRLDAILIIAPVVLATFMEHIGDITTNGSVVGKDFVKDPGLHRTLIGDGLATMFAGLMGSVPNTTYSENTGVLAITKNYDPRTLRIAAVLAIAFSFFNKAGLFLQTIPHAVIGGVSFILFGMIASIGVKTLANSKVNFDNPKVLMIIAVMLTIGLGGVKITIGNFEMAGVALSSLVGISLNLILPDELLKKADKKVKVSDKKEYIEIK
jgi:uracil permease